MLSQTVFPPDIRLEKEIRTLFSAGYKINVLCNQYEKRKENDFKYCTINRVNAIFREVKLNKVINFPLFLNPRFLYFVLKKYIDFKPDIVHAHDLPMVPFALILKWLFNTIIIYDMHENYPQALRFFEKKGIVNFLFKNYKIALMLDKFCIKRVDRVIVVVQENKERMIDLGVDPQKIFLVSNTIDIDSYNKFVLNQDIKRRYEKNKIILYTGAVSPDRGLDTPIKAMKFLSDKIKDAMLLIVGEGPNLEKLKILAYTNEVENTVEFIGWPGHEQLVTYWDLADICIIPQPSNDFINTTVPHKLFEYMFFRKPVLVSDAKPLKRIIEETGAGEIFVSNDEKDFAIKAIEMLLDNKEYGKYGYKAVIKTYNWTIDSKELLKLYLGFEKLSEKQTISEKINK